MNPTKLTTDLLTPTMTKKTLATISNQEVILHLPREGGPSFSITDQTHGAIPLDNEETQLIGFLLSLGDKEDDKEENIIQTEALRELAKLWLHQIYPNLVPIDPKLLISTATFHILTHLEFTAELGYLEPKFEEFSDTLSTILLLKSGQNQDTDQATSDRVEITVSFLENTKQIFINTQVFLGSNTLNNPRFQKSLKGLFSFEAHNTLQAQNVAARYIKDLKALLTQSL